MTLITLEGYYCIAKEYPDLDRTLLDKTIFKLSARKFKIENLHILGLDRIYGSFISPIPVRGVINTDVKGSLIPFFIERQKAIKLQEIIDTMQGNTSINL